MGLLAVRCPIVPFQEALRVAEDGTHDNCIGLQHIASQMCARCCIGIHYCQGKLEDPPLLAMLRAVASGIPELQNAFACTQQITHILKKTTAVRRVSKVRTVHETQLSLLVPVSSHLRPPVRPPSSISPSRQLGSKQCPEVAFCTLSAILLSSCSLNVMLTVCCPAFARCLPQSKPWRSCHTL